MTKIYTLDQFEKMLIEIQTKREKVFYIQPLKGGHGSDLRSTWEETVTAAGITLDKLPEPIKTLTPWK